MNDSSTSKRKTDKRTISTKAAIKKALLEMMKDIPFSRISVKELCERIGINRTTFYIHYANTQDVLIDLIDEFLAEKVNDDLVRCKVGDEKRHCPYRLCCKIHTNRQYGLIFFDDSLKSIVIDRISEMSKEGFIREMMTQYTLNKADAESIFYFQVNGCLAVNKMVFNRGSGGWEHTNDLLSSFIQDGLSKFRRI